MSKIPNTDFRITRGTPEKPTPPTPVKPEVSPWKGLTDAIAWTVVSIVALFFFAVFIQFASIVGFGVAIFVALFFIARVS